MPKESRPINHQILPSAHNLFCSVAGDQGGRYGSSSASSLYAPGPCVLPFYTNSSSTPISTYFEYSADTTAFALFTGRRIVHSPPTICCPFHLVAVLTLSSSSTSPRRHPHAIASSSQPLFPISRCHPQTEGPLKLHHREHPPVTDPAIPRAALTVARDCYRILLNGHQPDQLWVRM